VTAALDIRGAALSLGGRALWRGLDLTVPPGEFVAVLGANGSGKTSLLRAILGQQPLDAGTIEVAGHPVRLGDRAIGYVPQQRLASLGLALRGRDLVTMGVDGTRFGLPIPSRATRARVDAVLASVGATATATQPFGTLSGGEQQRLRIAQAIASDPSLLLCDEPLSSLDLHHQKVIASLIDQRRRTDDTAVLFVTHDINPVLGMVDRVLYLAQGGFTIGTPDEVLRTEVLSGMYGTRVEVIRTGGRIVVAGIPDQADHHQEAGHDV
jgi:zinc/manganese transport system ATP-binding protein